VKTIKVLKQPKKSAQPFISEITEIMQVLNMEYGIKGLAKETFHYSFSMVYNGLKQLRVMLNRYFVGSDVLHGRLIKFGHFNGLDQSGKILLNMNDLPSDWRFGLSSVFTSAPSVNKIKELEISLKDCCHGLNFIRPRGGALSYPVHLYLKELSNIYLNLCEEVCDKTQKYKDILSIYDWHADFVAISSQGYLKIPTHVTRSHLLNYLDRNLTKIRKARKDHLKNLYLEQTSMSSCRLKLGLQSLEKDVAVNTMQIINACNHLEFCDNVDLMKHWSVMLSNYYSISADGLVRIPWDFEQ